jgi:hypothetical protein
MTTRKRASRKHPAGSSEKTPPKSRRRRKKNKGVRQPASLVQFFSQSPLAKTAIDLERKPDYGSAVKL